MTSDEWFGLSGFGELLKEVLKSVPPDANREVFENAWKSHTDAARRIFEATLAPLRGLQANLGLLASAWSAPLRQASAFAAVGYTREWQERLQRIERAASGATQAHAKLQAVHAEIAVAAWEALGRRIAGQGEDGRSLGLREIYDAWIDCAEDAYQRRVMRPDYAREYGEALNRLFALKSEVGQLLDALLRLFNLPTRRELDAIHQRLRAGASPGGKHTMDAEVAALKQQVDDLAKLWISMQRRWSELAEAAPPPTPAAPSGPAKANASGKRRPHPRRERSDRVEAAAPAAQEWDIGNL